MPLDNPAGSSEPEQEFEQELEYLYKRLSTVDNLIRTLEDYEQYRPKLARLPKQKTA